jgi:hypothetical protein
MQIKTQWAVLAGLAVASSASALDFDFSGTFTKDNDVALFYFTVGDAAPSSMVTVFSSSWLTANPPQGFDPILAIWTDTGVKLAEQDDGGYVGSTLSNGVSYDHGTWDSYYTVTLTPGDYIATVGQFDNFSKTSNLADGFRWDGADNDNFTWDQNYGGRTQPYFNGVWDDSDGRSPNYEFHLLNVAAATHRPPPVPDTGSTLGLLSLAIGGAFALRRKA